MNFLFYILDAMIASLALGCSSKDINNKNYMLFGFEFTLFIIFITRSIKHMLAM